MRVGRIPVNKQVLLGVAAAGVAVAVVLSWRPVLVELSLHRARRALRVRDNERALDELRSALRLALDRSETHLLLARAHRRLGNLERVPALLRRARKLGADPERAQRETWLLLAQSGRLVEAEPHLADLLMDPRDDGADICQAYVQGYFTNLRVSQATELLDAWEKEYPDDARPHFMRAYLLDALAMRKEAVVAYRRGLAMAPHETVMRLRLAEALIELGEFDEAGDLLERCAEEEPESREVLMAWASRLSSQGDVDGARRTLQRLLADAPDHFEARRLLGEIELSLGRFQEALPHLEAAAVRRSYDTTTHNALARTLRALGRTDEAQPHFDYVSEAEEPLSRMERQLRVVVERPADPELRYEIGVILLNYGSPDDGAKWLRTVLQLEPDHVGAHQALAVYCQTRGDWRKAFDHRRSGHRPTLDPLRAARSDRDTPSLEGSTPPTPEDQNAIQLRDVTAETGIRFRHTDGSSGRRYIVETMSAGLALLDYNGDGYVDVYFLNGAPLPGTEVDVPPRNALYRNEGDWRFTDVTDEAGVGDTAFGLGVTAGDYDNDGDEDLFLNNYGPNVLYRNNGDGTFTDVTEQAGIAGGDKVGAGACFLDMEGDGDLDLYVSNYVQFSYHTHKARVVSGVPAYPGPLDHPPEADVLYRNNADGSFTDVSVESRVAEQATTGMGMIACDYDDDGDTDIFVANDVMANLFLQNDGSGKFKEVAISSGTAFDSAGMPQSSMGVACADYDNDGRLDLYVTSYANEHATLYRNLGDGFFHDATLASGAGRGTLHYVTWGPGFVDFDNDGDRDLFVACGHTDDNVELVPVDEFRKSYNQAV